MLNAFKLGTGVEGVSFTNGEEEVRTPSSGDDGAEMVQVLRGEPPGVFVVLRDVDLRVGDVNGDSAELLLPVGVPNTEVLARLSDAFSAVPKVVEELEAKEANPPADAEALDVFSGVVDATGVAPNGEEFVAANALNPSPYDFETLAADAKVVEPDANALNPLEALVSGEPKAAGAGGLPKVLGVLAKAANPLAEVAGVMPKLGFPKVGCPACPNEDFPKVGDANPD